MTKKETQAVDKALEALEEVEDRLSDIAYNQKQEVLGELFKQLGREEAAWQMFRRVELIFAEMADQHQYTTDAQSALRGIKHDSKK